MSQSVGLGIKPFLRVKDTTLHHQNRHDSFCVFQEMVIIEVFPWLVLYKSETFGLTLLYLLQGKFSKWA